MTLPDKERLLYTSAKEEGSVSTHRLDHFQRPEKGKERRDRVRVECVLQKRPADQYCYQTIDARDFIDELWR